MGFTNTFGQKGLLLFVMVLGGALTCGATYVDPKLYGSPKGEICITCHRETSPGIYNQWKEGGHGQAGVNCYDCHRAEKDDADAFEHKEWISILVTPKDCAKCHENEAKQFSSSHHAEAVSALRGFDNVFGRTVWGSKNQWIGCNPCHGSTVVVEEKGQLSVSSWPNTGIGRINPDKSKGSCSACHTRHLFSKEQARRPDSCSRCHTGSGQPQTEVYTRSKHGMMYAAYRDRMSMAKSLWRAGQDYFQAPTCATCHMSAIPPQMEVQTADERIRTALESVLSKDRELITALLPPTEPSKVNYGASHNVSARLSWKLAPDISTKRDQWQENRQLMQSVCLQCHGEHFIKQHYSQFDDLVETYNTKFAAPANRMVKDLLREKEITKESFDDKLERIYWKLWNEGGHSARSGAAMAGPVYAWTEGMQEVARRFHMQFIPEVNQILNRKGERFLKDHGYVKPNY